MLVIRTRRFGLDWMSSTSTTLPHSAFTDRILIVDTAVAQRSARLHVPGPRPVRDGRIAATALVHGMSVVTRNVADFEATGVRTLKPWTNPLEDR